MVTSLSFPMMHTFPETTFSQFPLNFFDYNNILIPRKKDVEHIPVNTARATFLLHRYLMSEATVPSFPSYSCSKHFRKYRWTSPYVRNEFLWKLCTSLNFLCLCNSHLISLRIKAAN